MTEQFAFQQIQWDRRAVQLDKWASEALTGVVNGMCDELLRSQPTPDQP
jgi:hypothetical protein